MATQKGYILSQRDRDGLSRAIRYVDAQAQGIGPTNGSTSGNSDGRVWLEVRDSDGAPSENTYTVDVYPSPYSTTAIATGKTAWNIWERGNSATTGCGYAIVDDSDGSAPCGSITGLEYIATGQRFPALWFGQRPDKDDQWGYVFSERLDPIVKGAA